MDFAQFIEKENLLARHFPAKERYLANIVALRFGSNLIYHNGPVIPTAFVVPIFWGPTWSGSDRGVATSLTNFIDGNGSNRFGLWRNPRVQRNHPILRNWTGLHHRVAFGVEFGSTV
jgi:hypothetical protein